MLHVPSTVLDTYARSGSQRADVITDMLQFNQPTLHLRVLFVSYF